MLMAIDVGNTNMVFGLLEGKELVGSFRLMTDANRTSDEIGLTVCEYFRRFNLSTDQVCDIIIASVVPQVMYTLTSAIVKCFGKKPILIDDDVSPGIQYEGEDHLGADRAVSCVAAMEKYGKTPLVVLDFGTAPQWMPWMRRGSIWAGVFWPGSGSPRTRCSARPPCFLGLSSFVPPPSWARTPLPRFRPVLSWVTSAPLSISSAIPRRRWDTATAWKVVATGGLARLIADNTDLIDVVDSQLIVDGLRIIYERYQKQRGK